MNVTEAKYQQRLAQADAEGVQVIARVENKEGKLIGYMVKSGAALYSVIVKKCSLKCSCKCSLKCSCMAGENDTYCKHRAVSRRYEMQRAAARKAQAQERAAAVAEATVIVNEDRETWATPARAMGPRITR